MITFCIDLLLIRGPLPAGEVGKILSEASSVQNLSHRLREKYGGLKKFLERYPELFIFSNDHPFNPHILLRQTISAENLELIDRGIFPLHLLSKTSRPVSPILACFLPELNLFVIFRQSPMLIYLVNLLPKYQKTVYLLLQQLIPLWFLLEQAVMEDLVQ